MTAPIQQLFALCTQILGKGASVKKELLSPIISVLNKITKNDICFSPIEFKVNDAGKRHPAPVSYMELYRDKTFTMAVFVVKAGGCLPLHDHPNMFGMLKLIHGSLKLVSYSEIESESVSRDALHETSGLNVKPVIKNPDIILTAEDECCVLTPSAGNIHEIHPLTDVIAFLDILTPSYGSHSSCHYYQEIEKSGKSSKSSKRWLVQIREPETYWCDPLPYRGPRLM